MITIPRSLARQLRAVICRALGISSRGPLPPLVIETSPDGLAIRSASPNVAVEYRQPGQHEPQQFAVPLALLRDCEGRKNDPVQIEVLGDGRTVASWHDQAVPIVKQYEAVTAHSLPGDIPVPPYDLKENPPELLAALHDAMGVTDRDAIRYATDHVRLRGEDGSLAATDGKHLLVHKGFHFPWEGEVIVPRSAVFGSRELDGCEVVLVGHTENWVTIRAGAWTFHLRINKEARFPRVDDVVPDPQSATARVSIGDTDTAFLVQALKRLPSEDETHYPVTIDLNGSVAVRARQADDGRVTELVLRHSSYSGEAVRLNTNRRFLAHALQLGFREVHIFEPTTPLLCRDERRSYVWAVLEPESAIKPSEDALRIESPEPASAEHTKPTRKRRTKTAMPNSETPTSDRRSPRASQNGSPAQRNGHADNHQAAETTLARAVALRDSLRVSVSAANELIRAIKREKRQSKIVRSTLASLRQLRAIDA